MGLYVNPIRHMLSVFASFCALISVEYILINKTNVYVLIYCDLPAYNVSLGGELSSALWINADFEEKNSIKNLTNFRRMTIYCLHLFQGVLAIFFRTMGAESTWNFKKKLLLLVFEVGSIVLAIF
jgi:hypothetical protein